MKTDEFLDLVKATANIPTSQSTFTDIEILAFASDEVKSKIVPLLLSVREEYLVVESDIALVADQKQYRIPSRAIGMKLREIQYVDSNDNVSNLSRLDIENISSNNTGTPTGFYLKANKVVLYPTPSTTSGSLRLTYFRRPSKLIKLSNAGLITAINTSTKTVSLSVLTNTSIIATAKMDFIQLCSHDILQEENVISSISGSDVIFTSTLPTDLAVGDYIALKEETPIIQLPEEISGLLVARTVLRIFESQNDTSAIKIIAKRIEEIQEDILDILTPRVEGEPKKIISNNNIRNWV